MNNISRAELFNQFKLTYGKLSHLATSTSHRRFVYEEDLRNLGNPFAHDLRAILQSKAWRRQCCKNQVSFSDHTIVHLRNRSTHVAEVVALAVWITEHLGLNYVLAMAIAEMHDCGHVPFGHQGEHYLQNRIGKNFCHEVMGVVIMQHIERSGKGTNLTHATLDSAHRHSGCRTSLDMTPEAWVVRFADKIAYLFADYNDFARIRHQCSKELDQLMLWFGKNQRERTAKTVVALCEESVSAGRIQFSESEYAKKFELLRTLMYAEYIKVVEQDVARKLDPIYDLLERMGRIPPALGIALLTDREVSAINREGGLLNNRHIMETGLGEILELVPQEKLFSIDITDLDLDW